VRRIVFGGFLLLVFLGILKWFADGTMEPNVGLVYAALVFLLPGVLILRHGLRKYREARAEASGPPALPVHCNACGTAMSQKPRVSFLGFATLACAGCGKRFLYPLTSDYRVAYCILSISMALLLHNSATIRAPVFGLLAVCFVVLLIKDSAIRRNADLPTITWLCANCGAPNPPALGSCRSCKTARFE
jgi:hypothetical protein